MKTNKHYDRKYKKIIKFTKDFLGHDEFLYELHLSPNQHIESEEEWNEVHQRLKDYLQLIIVDFEMNRRFFEYVEELTPDLVDRVTKEMEQELPDYIKEMVDIYVGDPSEVSI